MKRLIVVPVYMQCCTGSILHLVLTSPRSGGRLAGIGLLRTKASEFSLVLDTCKAFCLPPRDVFRKLMSNVGKIHSKH
jgi:hypothetical protein